MYYGFIKGLRSLTCVLVYNLWICCRLSIRRGLAHLVAHCALQQIDDKSTQVGYGTDRDVVMVSIVVDVDEKLRFHDEQRNGHAALTVLFRQSEYAGLRRRIGRQA